MLFRLQSVQDFLPLCSSSFCIMLITSPSGTSLLECPESELNVLGYVEDSPPKLPASFPITLPVITLYSFCWQTTLKNDFWSNFCGLSVWKASTIHGRIRVQHDNKRKSQRITHKWVEIFKWGKTIFWLKIHSLDSHQLWVCCG